MTDTLLHMAGFLILGYLTLRTAGAMAAVAVEDHKNGRHTPFITTILNLTAGAVGFLAILYAAWLGITA